MDLIVGDIACTSMLVVGIVMVLAFLLLPKVVQWRRHRHRSDALAAIVMAALMVGLSAYAAAVYVEYADWRDSKTLEYTVNVTADEGGVLLVPISHNADLRSSLEVREGDADIEVTDTSHGQALRIAFTGTVSVRGRVETTGRLGEWNLTMLEDDWWVVKQFFWVGLGGTGPNGTAEVELSLERHTLTEDDWFWGVGHVAEGWQTFRVNYRHVDRNY